MRDIWVEQNRLNADLFDEDYDFVVIHDPQPAPILKILRDGGRQPARQVALALPHRPHRSPGEVWDLLRPYVEEYDAAILTMRQYVREGRPEDATCSSRRLRSTRSARRTSPMPDAEIHTACFTRYDIDPAGR